MGLSNAESRTLRSINDKTGTGKMWHMCKKFLGDNYDEYILTSLKLTLYQMYQDET